MRIPIPLSAALLLLLSASLATGNQLRGRIRGAVSHNNHDHRYNRGRFLQADDIDADDTDDDPNKRKDSGAGLLRDPNTNPKQKKNKKKGTKAPTESTDDSDDDDDAATKAPKENAATKAPKPKKNRPAPLPKASDDEMVMAEATTMEDDMEEMEDKTKSRKRKGKNALRDRDEAKLTKNPNKMFPKPAAKKASGPEDAMASAAAKQEAAKKVASKLGAPKKTNPKKATPKATKPPKVQDASLAPPAPAPTQHPTWTFEWNDRSQTTAEEAAVAECEYCAESGCFNDSAQVTFSQGSTATCAKVRATAPDLNPVQCELEREIIEATCCCDSVVETTSSLAVAGRLDNTADAPADACQTFCIGQNYAEDPIIYFSSGNDFVSCGGLQDLIRSGLSPSFCAIERAYIEEACCQPITLPPTPLPTYQPTRNPTKHPTVAPTPLPTSSPTPSPTSPPTRATPSPTPDPTWSPTLSQEPTWSPTQSQHPTGSADPTWSPTLSQDPTWSPTQSQDPSWSPTASQDPTWSPTAAELVVEDGELVEDANITTSGNFTDDELDDEELDDEEEEEEIPVALEPVVVDEEEEEETPVALEPVIEEEAAESPVALEPVTTEEEDDPFTVDGVPTDGLLVQEDGVIKLVSPEEFEALQAQQQQQEEEEAAAAAEETVTTTPDAPPSTIKDGGTRQTGPIATIDHQRQRPTGKLDDLSLANDRSSKPTPANRPPRAVLDLVSVSNNLESGSVVTVRKAPPEFDQPLEFRKSFGINKFVPSVLPLEEDPESRIEDSAVEEETTEDTTEDTTTEDTTSSKTRPASSAALEIGAINHRNPPVRVGIVGTFKQTSTHQFTLPSPIRRPGA